MIPQKDHIVCRRGPWKPPVLDLNLPAASFSAIRCTVRKKPALAQPDDTDTDVVGGISLTPGAHGAITLVGASAIQLEFVDTVVRTWILGEYVYDVQGVLIADEQPYPLIKGRLTMTWAVTQT